MQEELLAEVNQEEERVDDDCDNYQPPEDDDDDDVVVPSFSSSSSQSGLRKRRLSNTNNTMMMKSFDLDTGVYLDTSETRRSTRQKIKIIKEAAGSSSSSSSVVKETRRRSVLFRFRSRRRRRRRKSEEGVVVAAAAAATNQEEEEEDDDDDCYYKNKPTIIYRIRSISKTTTTTRTTKPRGGSSSPSKKSINYNNKSTDFILTTGLGTRSIISFIRWTFRATFFQVFLSCYFFWLFLILLFASLIYIIGQREPECIATGTSNFLEAGTMYMDAFQLSWTTFSTVGYGIIAPTIENTDGHLRCIGLKFLMAFEAFVGVLYAGFVSALILGKVARIDSTAQVMFSHPICVTYGSGLQQQLLQQQQIPEEDKAAAASIGGGSSNSTTNNNNSIVGVDSSGESRRNGHNTSIQTVGRQHSPCPLLEFRLVNEHSGTKGSEIINASVNVVASTIKSEDDDEENDSTTLRDWETVNRHSIFAIASVVAASTRRNNRRRSFAASVADDASRSTAIRGAEGGGGADFLRTPTRRLSQANGSIIQRFHRRLSGMAVMAVDVPGSDYADVEPKNEEKELEEELELEFAERFAAKLRGEQERVSGVAMVEKGRTSVVVEEDNSNLAPQRVFHKLDIETDSHPFFKRQWIIRHHLDESSPLLTPQARRMIADNNGIWPDHLNAHAEIRKHVRFRELICSFSGTSNATGSIVYGTKVYDFSSVNIGYTFANVLHYCERSGKLIADKSLINDIRIQRGGGAEPLVNSREPRTTRMATAGRQMKSIATNMGTNAKRAFISAGAKVQRSGSVFHRDHGELHHIPEDN